MCKIQSRDSIEILGNSSFIYGIKKEKSQLKLVNNNTNIIENVTEFDIERYKTKHDLEVQMIVSILIYNNEGYSDLIIDEGDKLCIIMNNNINDNSLEKYNQYLMELNELNNLIRLKDEEIKGLKKIFPFEINQEDKIMTVIFTTTEQKFFYPIICKNTDMLANLVSQLFKEYPDYKDSAVYFMCNGSIIKEYKTLDENKIKNRDIILLNLLSNSSS